MSSQPDAANFSMMPFNSSMKIPLILQKFLVFLAISLQHDGLFSVKPYELADMGGLEEQAQGL